MLTIPPPRRFACAAFGVALAGYLFHGSLADALITRGDDALRNGDDGTALRVYRRALWLDPRSAVAADRVAFFLAIRHDPTDARAAVAVSSRALQFAPDDPALLADRAFADLQLADWRAAERDFARVAHVTKDARFVRFARKLALRR